MAMPGANSGARGFKTKAEESRDEVWRSCRAMISGASQTSSRFFMRNSHKRLMARRSDEGVVSGLFLPGLLLFVQCTVAVVLLERWRREANLMKGQISDGDAWVFLVAGLICVVLTIYDLASYRPRAIASCTIGSPPGAVFEKLSELSHLPAIDQQEISNIVNGPSACTWQEVDERVQSLLLMASKYMGPTTLRLRVVRRVLRSLVFTTIGLSMLVYGWNVLSNGGIFELSDPQCMEAMREFCGVGDHAYISLTTLFTMGYAELVPAMSAHAVLFYAVCATILITLGYFILAPLTGAFQDFENNLRANARSFVVSSSQL